MAAEVSQRRGRIQPPLPGPFQLCRCCRSVAQGACPAQSLKTLGSTLLPRRVLAASRHFSSCDTAVREGRGSSESGRRESPQMERRKGTQDSFPCPGKLRSCKGLRQVPPEKEGRRLCCGVSRKRTLRTHQLGCAARSRPWPPAAHRVLGNSSRVCAARSQPALWPTCLAL